MWRCEFTYSKEDHKKVTILKSFKYVLQTVHILSADMESTETFK